MNNFKIYNNTTDMKDKTIQNESVFTLIKRGLITLWRNPLYYIFIAIYACLATFVWEKYIIFEKIPLKDTPQLLYPIVKNGFYGVMVFLTIAILLQIVIFIGMIGKISFRKFEKSFKRMGLTNSLGETPRVVAEYKDKEIKKQNGIVYEVENLEIPMEEFDKKTPNLQVAFKGIIYNMDYSENISYTRIFVLPYKYVKPYIISTNDDFLSNMINCLIVGKTRYTVRVTQP